MVFTIDTEKKTITTKEPVNIQELYWFIQALPNWAEYRIGVTSTKDVVDYGLYLNKPFREFDSRGVQYDSTPVAGTEPKITY